MPAKGSKKKEKKQSRKGKNVICNVDNREAEVDRSLKSSSSPSSILFSTLRFSTFNSSPFSSKNERNHRRKFSSPSSFSSSLPYSAASFFLPIVLAVAAYLFFLGPSPSASTPSILPSQSHVTPFPSPAVALKPYNSQACIDQCRALYLSQSHIISLYPPLAALSTELVQSRAQLKTTQEEQARLQEEVARLKGHRQQIVAEIKAHGELWRQQQEKVQGALEALNALVKRASTPMFESAPSQLALEWSRIVQSSQNQSQEESSPLMPLDDALRPLFTALDRTEVSLSSVLAQLSSSSSLLLTLTHTIERKQRESAELRRQVVESKEGGRGLVQTHSLQDICGVILTCSTQEELEQVYSTLAPAIH